MREEHDTALAERDRLARELEAERSNRPAAGTYPREGEVYGSDRVDPANPDTAYSAYPQPSVADEESRRHTV